MSTDLSCLGLVWITCVALPLPAPQVGAFSLFWLLIVQQFIIIYDQAQMQHTHAHTDTDGSTHKYLLKPCSQLQVKIYECCRAAFDNGALA